MDDRVLSSDGEAGAGSGGGAGGDGGGGGAAASAGGPTCVDRGSSACETCLYARCCAQTRDCEVGSECVAYLDCAEPCSGAEGCLSTCSRQHGTGFGDAVALGACAQSQCPSCGADAEDPSPGLDGCEASGNGACQNPTDCEVLGTGELDGLDPAACPACIDLSSAGPCANCLSLRAGLSLDCAGCVSNWLGCAVDLCDLFCQDETDSATCDSCLSETGCEASFARCAFGG